MKCFVYLLECSDGTFYIGSTTDVERRIHEHNHAKNGAHYTKIRRPVRLRYTETFETLSEARKREYELKQLSRKQKEELLFSLSIDGPRISRKDSTVGGKGRRDR